MTAYHESPAHQRAKTIVAAACERAGYAVTVEAIGADWRADVLAARGTVRLAFEVQWSPLKLREAIERQARYARDGARGCWLFRRAPGGSPAHGEEALIARRDLPLFHLIANADETFYIYLDKRTIGLDDFITALVSGGVKFSEAARLAPTVAVELALYALTCPICRQGGYTASIAEPVTGRCGTRLTLSEDESSRLLAGATLPAGVLRGDRCPHCDGTLPARTIWLAGYGMQPRQTVSATVATRDTHSVAHAHWCMGGEAGWCV
ncbi:MAG: hypothetical protein SGJ24_09620 [Chloroflexota bacterium]|nr:hypothetical protein [Chloroflexota bacterium]